MTEQKQLQVTDLLQGTGKTAVKGALITAHYTGYLDDGSIFDSSVQRGRPFECVIGTGRVIKGWDLGVLGFDNDMGKVAAMQVGGKRQLKVPSHLAYGERSMGKITPHSDLTFEIELFDVKTRDE
ncbi:MULTISPECIES: FKBP-type peptidyl-prolyl cis-trans isomerase [unclassified Acinetobacter]|uniref:FKBP-type peptidyl-prolyl cis-trans isomerase n=1 Tax=unclassified Acinetobacter TaxID=196816 RepID=UPI0035B95DDC